MQSTVVTFTESQSEYEVEFIYTPPEFWGMYIRDQADYDFIDLKIDGECETQLLDDREYCQWLIDIIEDKKDRGEFDD